MKMPKWVESSTRLVVLMFALTACIALITALYFTGVAFLQGKIEADAFVSLITVFVAGFFGALNLVITGTFVKKGYETNTTPPSESNPPQSGNV